MRSSDRSARPRSVLLSGAMAAGKSSVARALCLEFGFSYRSFGDLVRAEAAARGLNSSDRETLQDLGQQLFEDYGPVLWAGKLIADASEPIAVDGVRHVAVREALADALPGAISVFLEISSATLEQRRSGRGAEPVGSAGHLVENQLALLRQTADLVIRSEDASPADIAARILAAAQNS